MLSTDQERHYRQGADLIGIAGSAPKGCGPNDIFKICGMYFGLTCPAFRLDQHVHRVRPPIPEIQPDATVRQLCDRRRN